MKTKIYLFIIFVFYSLKASGQKDTLLIDNFLLDFTIPDMPAFKALGTNPSEILRPSDFKKFAVMLDAFRTGESFTIPKSFALEVAPWKLGSKNLTLSDYRNNGCKRFLYNTAFSLGTARDENDITSKVAIGAKFKLYGKNADFITNEDRVNEAYAILDSVERSRAKMLKDWRRKNNISVSDFGSDTTVQNEFKEYFLKNTKDSLRFSIKEKIEKFNEDNWNAGRIDAAVAWLGNSSDSLIKNLYFDSWKGWITFAIRPDTSWHHFQILFGLNGSYNRKIEGESKQFTWSGNLRLYKGTKDFHGFLEFQKKDDLTTEKPTNLINLGAELRVKQDFWLVFSGGVDNVFGSDFKSRFISSVDLRYAFNK